MCIHVALNPLVFFSDIYLRFLWTWTKYPLITCLMRQEISDLEFCLHTLVMHTLVASKVRSFLLSAARRGWF